MAIPLTDNLVHETTTDTGTGTLALTPYSQSFNQAFGNGVTTDVYYYFIQHRTLVEWEWGTGHNSDATHLVRDTVIQSSNANAHVNFSAGTKDVCNDLPATMQNETITSPTAELILGQAGGGFGDSRLRVTGTAADTSFQFEGPSGLNWVIHKDIPAANINFAATLTWSCDDATLFFPGNQAANAGDFFGEYTYSRLFSGFNVVMSVQGTNSFGWASRSSGSATFVMDYNGTVAHGWDFQSYANKFSFGNASFGGAGAVLDYNITNASAWTIGAGAAANLYVNATDQVVLGQGGGAPQSIGTLYVLGAKGFYTCVFDSTPSAAGIAIFGFRSVGPNYDFGLLDASGLHGTYAGFYLQDMNTGNGPLFNTVDGTTFQWVKTSSIGIFAWSNPSGGSLASYAGADADTGLSRNAAGVVAVGNGTLGDTSGALQATVAQLTPVTIATLPATPVFGMICAISDGDAALAWGATAVNSGAGATKYIVWYNNANWTVMGK